MTISSLRNPHASGQIHNENYRKTPGSSSGKYNVSMKQRLNKDTCSVNQVKKSKKKMVFAAILTAILAGFALKKGMPFIKKLINSKGKTPPVSAPASPPVAAAANGAAQVREVIRNAEGMTVKYPQNSPFTQAVRTMGLDGKGSKHVSLTLKDGKEIAVHYGGGKGVKAYSVWASGGIKLGACQTKSFGDALSKLGHALKTNGYESDVIVKELRTLMTMK